MKPPKKAAELLNLYYLDARSHLLETAAILDRIERAEGGRKAMQDARIRKLLMACDLLKGKSSDRAAQFLVLFSEPPEGCRARRTANRETGNLMRRRTGNFHEGH